MARPIAAALLLAIVLRNAHAHSAPVQSQRAPCPAAQCTNVPVFEAVALRAERPPDLAESMRADEKPIGRLTTDVRPSAGELPADEAAAVFSREGRVAQRAGEERGWGESGFCWEAPALCHPALVFEDANVERYGYSLGLAQPLASAAHFFGRIPAIPYLRTVDPQRKCIYTLGYRRPGSYTPHQYERFPLSVRGALAEGAVVTGLIFAIP